MLSNKNFVYMSLYISNFLYRGLGFTLILIALFIPFLVQAQSTANNEMATRFVRLYNHQSADSLFMHFSPDVKQGLPLDKTIAFVEQINSQLGKITSINYLTENSGHSVYKANFEHGNYVLTLSLKEGVIGGMYVQPGKPEASKADSLSPDNISLKVKGGSLPATLLIPAHKAKPLVVLIVAGSGPTDRNGNQPAGVNANAYLLLAKALADSGIASLRYDKRLSGKGIKVKEEDIRFEDYVADCRFWISKLLADERFSGVVVAGHSEGCLVAMAALTDLPVKGFISLAGAGYPADEILKLQLSGKLDKKSMTTARVLIDSLKAGNQPKQAVPANLQFILRKEVQPYLMSWMKYSPVTEIGKLRVFELIIQGGTDIQVTRSDAGALVRATKLATLKIIPDMNHVLKQAPKDLQANLATYTNPSLPLHPDLVPIITKYLKTLK